MQSADEHHYVAQDGARLFYRAAGDPGTRGVPVLCLPGLTRNSRDFLLLAGHLSSQRRVIMPDYRGRGLSDHTGADTYTAAQHISDILHLLAIEGLHRVAVIGTSMGGLLAMGLAAAQPSALAGVVINDVGPDIAGDGEGRIVDYVGRDTRFPDLASAAAESARLHSPAFPDWQQEDWLHFAANTYRHDKQAGNWRLDYDMALGTALRRQLGDPGATPDLWALFGGLRHVPALLVRGALSDVLAEATVDRMRAVKPDLQVVTLANRGHAPTLREADCRPRILAFLEKLDEHHRH